MSSKNTSKNEGGINGGPLDAPSRGQLPEDTPALPPKRADLSRTSVKRTRKRSQKITVKKPVASGIQDSNQLFKTVVANLPGIVFVLDREGRFQVSEGGSLAHLGLKSGQVVGLSANVLYSGFPEILYGIQQALRGEANRSLVEVSGQVFDTWYTPLFDATGAVDGVLGLANDITDLKQAGLALRDSEERYRLLADNSQDMISLHNEHAAYLYASPAIVTLLGYTQEEALGRSAYEFIHPEDVIRIQDHHREIIKGAAMAAIEYRIIRKDSREIWCESNARVIRDEHNGIRILVVSRDITQRRRMDCEQRQLEMKIQQTQKMESLGVLAGGIAHDFNNMLMAIMGNAELAAQDLPKESPIHEMLHEIDKTAYRAADLCRQMLAYSGQGSLIINPLNLSTLVQGMHPILQSSIAKKATLRLQLATSPPLIEADANQLKQMVMNLVVNASEALEERGGAVGLATEVLECTREHFQDAQAMDNLTSGCYVCLEVSDNGCGMPQEILGKIFDPFFSTKFQGRGLGLPAVLGIVRSHHGAIKVFSEPGKGSTFKVFFPAMPEYAAVEPETSKTENSWRGAGVVLLADDEASVLTICRRMLERMGFTVLSASDGQQALELFQQHQKAITCVMLDLTMPRLDGQEACHALRAMDADVPVIISSGYAGQEVEPRFSGENVSGFIQKPYRMNNLRAVLHRVLGGMKEA